MFSYQKELGQVTLDEDVEFGVVRDTELPAHGIGQLPARSCSLALEILSDRHLRGSRRRGNRDSRAEKGSLID